jgi:hypothetical protein
MRTRGPDADAKQVENACLHISSVPPGRSSGEAGFAPVVFEGQAAGFSASRAGFPQHFLYLRPERQGHGEFRGVFDDLIGVCAGAGAAVLQNELVPWLRICSQRRLSACVMSASRSSSPIRLSADGLAVAPVFGDAIHDSDDFGRVGEACNAWEFRVGADDAFRLEFAKLVHRAPDDDVGLSARPVDRALSPFVSIGLESEVDFDYPAAAKPPVGGHDSSGEKLFKGSLGIEFAHQVVEALDVFLFLTVISH